LHAAEQALANSQDDDAMRANVAVDRALWADRRGDEAESAAQARRAVLLGERSGNAIAAAVGHGQLSWLALSAGDTDTAMRHLQHGLEWIARHPDAEKRATYENMLRQIRIEALLRQRRFADAADEIEQLLALPGRSGTNNCGLLQRRSVLACDLGDLDEARRCAEECLALATEIELPRMQCAAYIDLAAVALQQGDAAAGAAWAQRALALANEINLPDSAASARAQLAEAALAQGNLVAALADAAEAARLHDELGPPASAAAMRALAAVTRLAADDAVGALAAVEQVLAQPDLPPQARHRCGQVLAALQDPRAITLQHALGDELQALLRDLPDDAARTRLLDNVPPWRDIAGAARRRLLRG
jgi:tetratricopeptide (TPR) repeat protein